MPPAKVLVADDAPDSLQLLEDLLTDEGHEVITAYDGAQALEKAFKEQPDVILLDVMMPKMDGFEVCRRIKQDERMHSTPVMIVTVLRDDENRARGAAAGADDFMSKPFSRHDLLRHINQLVERGE
jgi:two-component system cell cycle response regulator